MLVGYYSISCLVMIIIVMSLMSPKVFDKSSPTATAAKGRASLARAPVARVGVTTVGAIAESCVGCQARRVASLAMGVVLAEAV